MRLRSLRRGLPFAGALVVFAAIAAGRAHGEAPASAAAIEPAKACAACHPAHFEQWSKGAHAKGSANPVFAAMRARYPGAKAECDSCHEPEAAGKAAGVDFRGVSCDHCHTTKDVRPGTGIAALVREPGNAAGKVKRGPLVDAKPIGHLAEGDPELFSNRADLCLACHAGAPGVCVTPTDFALSPAARFGGRVCQDCHMSLAESKAAITAPDLRLVHDHTLLAAHDPVMLARGADVELAVVATNGGFVATAIVANKAAGHSFPSGHPLRVAAIRFRVLDSSGTPVWSSFTEDPPEDATLRRLEVGRDGQGPVLPWEALRVASDTRVLPLSARAIRARVPGARVEAQLLYWPIDPSVARSLGLAPQPILVRTVQTPP